MSSEIADFWLQNPEYWIATGETQRIADKIIYDKYHDYDFTQANTLGQIIFLDQFMRHFSRVQTISEDIIKRCRIQAAKIVSTLPTLVHVSEKELIWYLMPYKHLCNWTPLFTAIHTWLTKPITTYPTLNRFFMDSYKKAYTDECVAANLVLSTSPEPYNHDLICEYHPPVYNDQDAWTAIPLNDAREFLKPVPSIPLTVSLSGGVDSMLLTALLARAKADIIAVHIVYGNRTESIQERNFISTYCHKLSIPLYIYTVEWLKRDSVDRQFYETMTREIRFSAYKALKRPVLLGHIQEDVVENIWTNFAKGTHLDNLAKFTHTTVEDGVTVCRPWLQIKKQQIYDYATMLAIPHLKNTTPSWSNRGKFRTHFYQSTHDQYGPNVDAQLISVAERIRKQAVLIDKLLYQAIKNSYDPVNRKINITSAVNADLDADGWQNIFTELAHSKLGITKPRFAACEDFYNRVAKGLKHMQKINLHKNYCLEININGDEIWVKV